MKTRYLRVVSLSPTPKYSEAFKMAVVTEYEKGILNKDQIHVKYGIGGNSRVLEWCRKYGKLHYPEPSGVGRPMKDSQKQRIKELEEQFQEARLKVLAYERLISLTEKEEGISILKKDAAKQSGSLPKPTQEK